MLDKIPRICRRTVPLDRQGAGWFVHNSVRLIDIVPEWRQAGGGVRGEELTPDISESFDKAIAYTERHIAEAESHLKKLHRSKAELNT